MAAKSPAERKRKERQARRAAGLVPLEIWTTPERRALMLAIHSLPTQQELIAYLRRWLDENS